MPYKTFINWVFDGDLNSEIPTYGNGIHLSSYKSPINNLFLIKVFIRNPELNYFLDKYMNNMSLFYIDKEEMFRFIKEMTLRFRVKRNEVTYFLKGKKKTNLEEFVEEKFPLLKSYEIKILIDKILADENKNDIYKNLGLKQNYSKRKIKGKKKTRKHKKIESIENKTPHKKIPLKKFLQDNFKIVEFEKSTS